jgi:hypothetical protein
MILMRIMRLTSTSQVEFTSSLHDHYLVSCDNFANNQQFELILPCNIDDEVSLGNAERFLGPF